MLYRLRRTPALLLLSLVLTAGVPAQEDVPFLESPDYVVETMFDLAQVTDQDVVYDLGCGDGRFVIRAAKAHGARAVGIDINPELVELSRKLAAEAGVTDQTTFIAENFFESDFSDATVLMLYLWPKVNRRLKPMFVEQLAPGTRIVSHKFEIPGWEPQRRVKVGGRDIFLYVVR